MSNPTERMAPDTYRVLAEIWGRITKRSVLNAKIRSSQNPAIDAGREHRSDTNLWEPQSFRSRDPSKLTSA